MTRWLTWLDRGILWPIWIFCLSLFLLLFTLPGLKLSLFLAEKALPALHINEVSGSWLTGATLKGIRWQDDTVKLKLQQLDLRIQKRCLVQFRICIPELALAKLVVEYNEPAALADNTAANTNTPIMSSGVAFPVPIRIDRLQIDQVDIQAGALQLRWETFNIALNAWGNRLQLSNGLWQDVAIILPPATGEHEPVKQYTPPVLPTLDLPITVFVEHFHLDGLHLQQGETDHRLQSLQLSAQLTPRQIRILDLQLEHQQFNLQLSSNIDLLNHVPVTAAAMLNLTEGPLAGQQLQLQLFGDLAYLQAEAQARGPVEWQLSASVAPLTADLPLTLNLQSPALGWPLTQPEYHFQQIELAVNGSLSALQLQLQGDFQGEAIPSTHLQLRGSWQYWQQQLQLQQLSLTNAAGELGLKGEIALSPEPSWQLALELDKLQPEQIWSDFPGLIQGHMQVQGTLTKTQGLQLDLNALTLRGELRQLPLQLQGKLALQASPDWQQWQFVTPGLELGHGNNRLHIEGELNEQWQLIAQLELPDLAKSYPGLTGQIQGEFTIAGAAKTPRLAGQLSVQQLRYQDLRLGTAELVLSLDSARDFATTLQLNLGEGYWQQQQLQHLQLQLNGDLTQHQLIFKFEADQLSASLHATGQLLADGHWQGSIEDVLLNSTLGNWQLTAPLALGLNPQHSELLIAAHCWQQQVTALCLAEPARLRRDSLQARLRLTDFALQQLNVFLPYQSNLAGTAAAEIELAWHVQRPPELKFTLQVPTGTFTQQLDVPITLDWHDLQLDAEMTDHQLRLRLASSVADTGALQIQALISDLDQVVKPIRAELGLNDLTLNFLKPLVDEYSELDGVLSSQLSIDGTLGAPQLTGEFKLAGLKVRGKLAPTDIEQADLLVKFQGERAELEGLISTPEGRIELLGLANWQDLSAWQADLAISGDQIRVQIPQAELFLQPDLMVSAKPEYAKVTGSVFVPRGNISVDSLPQNAIGITNDLVLLDAQRQPIQEATQRLFNLETDIKLTLGQQVRLQAFGLRTRLVGELRIQQQQFNPNIRGEVILQDGTFRAYGQDLLIRQGKLTFNGPADQPFLNVEAIRNPVNMEDDVIAGIRVSGPADEPLVVIFSEPAKPQANALSYLIMGRDLDSESGFNANSVTTSLIAMSISSSGKLVGEIGEAFGVSDLMLDTEGAGDNSRVTVSGYLTRDLQLKYGIGIFQPIGQFTLRYRLLRNLYLEAVSGLDKAVDVLYKFEFD